MQPTIYQNLQALLHYNNSPFSPNNIKTVIIGPDGLMVGYHINKILGFKAYTVENLMKYNSEPKAKPLLSALHDGIQFPSIEEVIVIIPAGSQIFRPQDYSPASLVRNNSYSIEGLKQDYKRLRCFTVATSANANTMSTLFNMLAQQGLNKPGLTKTTISQYLKQWGMQVNITPVHSDEEYYINSGISIKSREMYPQMDGAQGELNLYFQKVKNHLLAQQEKIAKAAKAEDEKNKTLVQADNLDKFIQIIKQGVLNSKIPENMKYKIFSTEMYDTLKSKVYKYPKFVEKVQSEKEPSKYLKNSVSEIIEDITKTCKFKLKSTVGETTQKILTGDLSLANEAIRRIKAQVDIEPDAKLNEITKQLNSLTKSFSIEGSVLIDKATFLRLDDTYELSIAENNVYAYKKDKQSGITFRLALADKTSVFDLDKAIKDIVSITDYLRYRGTIRLRDVINLNVELAKCKFKASAKYIPNNATIKRILQDNKDRVFTNAANWNPEDNIKLLLLVAKHL